MAPKLRIGVCPFLLDEVRAVLAGEPLLQEVDVFAFAPSCPRPALTWERLRPLLQGAGPDDTFVLLGSTCLRELGSPPLDLPSVESRPAARCLDLAADAALVDMLVQSGAHLLTPGWVGDWPSRLEEWGMDAALAIDFFKEHASRLALLDTGIHPGARAALESFAAAVRMPFESVPVGLGAIRGRLMELGLAWRLRRVAPQWEAGRETLRQLHEYAMAHDLICRLSEARSEAEAAARLLELADVLFAPRQTFFLPLQDGRPEPPVARPPAASLPPDLLQSLVMWAGSGDGASPVPAAGFAVRIGGDEGPAEGVLAVLDVAFPQYQARYRDLAATIGKVGGLAIRNARAYERLKAAVTDLQAALAERDRLLSEVQAARAEAERANAAKSRFLAVMSHEIRTPLNAVLGFADLLKETPLTDDQRQFATIIRDRGADLLHLINQVLDLSRIESGRDEPEHAPFSLRALVDAARETVALAASRKNLAFSCVVAPDVPDRLIGDGDRLRQIVVNLLGNAVKFTERGEVALSVDRHESSSDPTVASAIGKVVLRISVRDTGPGIPRDRQAEIFEPFVQADRGIRRRYGGTGLGLAIVRRLVERMGGTLSLESEPGKGSCFRGILPFDLAGDDAAASR
jgi:signal transduction histidine kinase